MSRSYEAAFEVDADEKTCGEIADKIQEIWDVDEMSWQDGTGCFSGEGNLGCGYTEAEFVQDVKTLLTPEYNGVSITISMTYLEDLPYEEYDVVIGEEDAPCE